VEPITLVEQIAHLRQLAIADPDTSLLELTLINVLAELADAVQELSGRVAAAELAGLGAQEVPRLAPCPGTTEEVISWRVGRSTHSARGRQGPS